MSDKNLPVGVRKADELIYLNEDRRNQVKSTFRVAGNKITDFASKQNKRNGDLLDVGCATGDFLHHISTILTGYNLAGLEVSELIALEASKRMSSASIKISRLNSGETVAKNEAGSMSTAELSDIVRSL